MAGVEPEAQGGDHKVHFEAEQVQSHDSEITLKYSENRVDVHLGFLQINRYYDVTFTLQDDLGEDITFDPLQNLFTRIMTYTPTEDGLGHELTVNFHAHKEKLVKEKLTITSQSDTSKSMEILLHARVLGKGKGTPALRNGIKCTGMDYDNDSDQTEWQGFD